jgi:hypothetical protein
MDMSFERSCGICSRCRYSSASEVDIVYKVQMIRSMRQKKLSNSLAIVQCNDKSSIFQYPHQSTTTAASNSSGVRETRERRPCHVPGRRLAIWTPTAESHAPEMLDVGKEAQSFGLRTHRWVNPAFVKRASGKRDGSWKGRGSRGREGWTSSDAISSAIYSTFVTHV